MDRKIYITVPVSLILRADKGVELSQIMDDLIISAEIADDCDTFNKVDIEEITKGEAMVMDSK